MSASDATSHDLIEVLDLTGPVPERRVVLAAARGIPSTLSLLVQHPGARPTSAARDAALARRRALVGLYVDERA